MAIDSDTDSLYTSAIDTDEFNDDWRDLRLIHESEKGWCVLYSCLHRGHRIVVKALKEQYRDSEIHRRLLEKEYAIGHGMNHANVATVMWMEDVPELGLAILMEFVDGMTLGSYLASHSGLPVNDLLRIVDQICGAVEYLHSRQTVHCDLKPSNIMVTHDGGFVKLIDFGSSRGFGFEKLDITGGTHGFTAPENLRSSGDKATPKADIYSIGKLIALMDHDGMFRRVVSRCTAEDPALRPEHASEIPRLMRRELLRKRRTRRAIGLGSILAVIVAGIAWFVICGQREGEELGAKSAAITDSVVNPMGLDAGDSLAQALPVVENVDENLSIDGLRSDGGYSPASEGKYANQLDSSVSPDTALVPDKTMPLDAQLLQVTLRAAERRWRDNLKMIDTMTTSRSVELVTIEHWRWLAAQDVRRWLESKLLPGNPRIESLLADAEKAIRNFGEDPERVGITSQHRRKAIKRDPMLSGAATVYTRIDRESNRYYKDSLLEDGTWMREAGSLTPISGVK